MKKKNRDIKRRWPKVLGISVGVLLVILLIVPLFIPVNGADGLQEPDSLMDDDGYIVTLPFDGTDGIDTYYIYKEAQTETDRNFILLHGSQYNSSTWNEVIDYLSTKGNVYAYDQAPYGLSEKMLEDEWTAENPYTIDAATQQLEIFMNVLGIEKATLIGSSYGGVIAAEAAVNFPEKIDELIFVDAAIYVNESLPQWIMESPQMERIGPLLAKALGSGDKFYKSIYYTEEALSDERMNLNKLMTNFEDWDLAYWEYLQAWAVNVSDVSSQLDHIMQRTLVISGDEDRIIPVEQSKKLASELRNSTISIIENCGHMPHEERPAEFIQILDNWLDK